MSSAAGTAPTESPQVAKYREAERALWNHYGLAPAERVGGVIWQAPHGGYWVHFGQVVFGGTYLRTLTRLTTMESANESARHAVNAILDHVAGAAAIEGRAPIDSPRCAAVPSGVGDYCPIWSWERYEFAELDFLKDVDSELLRRGLPHLWDILELDELPLLLPERTSEPMLEVLRLLADRLEEQLGSPDPTATEALARSRGRVAHGEGPFRLDAPRGHPDDRAGCREHARRADRGSVREDLDE